MKKKKRKATTCSACRHHNKCGEECKVGGRCEIVYCLYFCKPTRGIEKWLIQRFGGRNIIARIVNFLMTRLFPVNAKRITGRWPIFIEAARAFGPEIKQRNLRVTPQRKINMAGLTVGDESEWEDIKKGFVNSGASSKSRLIVIQRLTKEYAVGMDEAEIVANRWGKECGEEARKACEKFTIGDVLKGRSGRRK